MTVLRQLVGLCSVVLVTKLVTYSWIALDNFNILHSSRFIIVSLLSSVSCVLFLFTSFPTSVYKVHMEYGKTSSPSNLMVLERALA